MNFKLAAEKFKLGSEIVSIERYGNGHINDTFFIETEKGDKFILQRVNTSVFKNPEQVISNIVNVTEYIKNCAVSDMKTLELIDTSEDIKFYKDAENNFWRVYKFIDDAVCLESAETAEEFYQSAVAFGKFQKMLSDFPVEKLFETIPDFHNTPVRYKNFLAAVESAPADKREIAAGEIEFVKERRDFCSVLENANRDGVLPKRVTHNDTKLNNVMLDAKTKTPLCVVDLDTVMPGYSVTDFGDSIRFGASTAAEDEKDLNLVHFDIQLFKAYLKGFLEGCGGSLKADEIRLMPSGAKMMTLECGMRFLSDYLEGNIYFKTEYPEHNLVRCRTQFKLVLETEEKWQEMSDIIEDYIKSNNL